MLHDALRRAVPDPLPPVVVHGDYRLGNILCDGDELCAVIDWEIWSAGDPRVDLGWFLTFTDQANFPGSGYPRRGMPTAEALLGGYEEARGATVPGTAWFLAFGRFKMAAIMGHNLRRPRESRYEDPYQETLVPTIASLIDQGLGILAG